jgi:hypothetical protein
MKTITLRTARVAVVLLSILSIACTSTTAPVARSEDRVAVFIESRPDWGEVYVDGKFVGTTAMSARLTPGVHSIEVRRQRHVSWKRDLTVMPGSATRVMALLESER